MRKYGQIMGVCEPAWAQREQMSIDTNFLVLWVFRPYELFCLLKFRPFKFGLLKIRPYDFRPFKNRELFCTKIVQLLSKWENMTKILVWVDLREYGTSKGPPVPIFRPFKIRSFVLRSTGLWLNRRKSEGRKNIAEN